MQTSITNLLARMSRVQPLLLVIDDVQWSDPETLHLLRTLARTAPEGRMLVIATLRERGVTSEPVLSEMLTDLSHLDGVTQLTIRKLGNEDVSAFVRAATGIEPSSELVSEIAKATDGNAAAALRAVTDLRLGGGRVSELDDLRDERRSA